MQQCVKLSESDGQASKRVERQKRSNDISRQVNKTIESEESSLSYSVKMNIIRHTKTDVLYFRIK
jgi:hypothetical protein